MHDELYPFLSICASVPLFLQQFPIDVPDCDAQRALSLSLCVLKRTSFSSAVSEERRLCLDSTDWLREEPML